MTGTSLDRLAELVTTARELTAHAASRVSAVERQLSGAHFVGTSDAGLVMASADHRARVTRIQVAAAGLTRTPGPELARQVVQAVHRAQDLARAEYERALRAAA